MKVVTSSTDEKPRSDVVPAARLQDKQFVNPRTPRTGSLTCPGT
jgi:hypothetical protein